MIKFEWEYLLNKSDEVGLLHANYDKLLHVVGTFAGIVFLNKLLDLELVSLSCVFLLQLIWIVLNRFRGQNYFASWFFLGDLLANMLGYGVYFFYKLM